MKKQPTQLSIVLRRYDPETEQLSTENYQIPYSHDLTVLDAITYIQREKNPGIAFRSSCRMGICGSCGAMINGKPALMCSTLCRNLVQPIKIAPLQNFRIIKDLICDTDAIFEKFRSANPYLTLATRHQDRHGITISTPAEEARLSHSTQCIKCLLCYSACPVISTSPQFIGPGAAAVAYRYQLDHREDSQAKKKRLQNLTSSTGIWHCSFIGECSSVCPKQVDPALALQKLKIMGVLNTFSSNPQENT